MTTINVDNGWLDVVFDFSEEHDHVKDRYIQIANICEVSLLDQGCGIEVTLKFGKSLIFTCQDTQPLGGFPLNTDEELRDYFRNIVNPSV